MMRLEYLLVVLMVSTVTVGAKKKGKKTQCEQEASQAAEANEDGPECSKNGNYKPRQCNETVCWCVNRKTGEPAFDNLEVPLDHRYKCKKEPGPCLRETLELLVREVTDLAKFPDCNKKGFYKPKQCEVVKRKKCREPARIKRQALGPCKEWYGSDPVDRSNVDNGKKWTFVNKETFPNNGKIVAFEFFVGRANKPLFIGTYRQIAPGTFTVVKLAKFPAGFPLGFIRVELAFTNIDVQAGDRLGISWTDKGVIDWAPAPTNNFYHNENTFIEGAIATMSDTYGKRTYSIRAEVVICEENITFSSPCNATTTGFYNGISTTTDSADVWTFVPLNPVSRYGEVTKIEVNVGAAGRTVKFGVYEDCPNECQFKLLEQYSWTSAALGPQTINLPLANRLHVNAGNYLGISWENQGVITYQSVAPQTYCEDSQTFSPGDTATLVKDRFGNREYDVRFTIDGFAQWFGYAPIDRANVDNGAVWTFVNKAPFPTKGQVVAIKCYVGRANKPVRFGIYRPTETGETGAFDVVRQLEFAGGSLSLGFNSVPLSGDDVLNVEQGYMFGIAWNDTGVIDYDPSEYTTYFYHIDEVYAQGDTTGILTDTYGKRIYSVKVEFVACKNNTPSVKLSPCNETTTGIVNLAHTNSDSADVWTFVPLDPVSRNGEVTKIEVNAGAAGRTVKFGVYEECPNECQFKLLEEYAWTSATLGSNVIHLSVSDRLHVKDGNYLGITWENKGAISYQTGAPQTYCEDSLTFSPGDTATLVKDRFGNREYDVRFTIEPLAQWFGSAPINRANVDNGLKWTFVNKAPFPTAGRIVEIEFYVGRANKPLLVGLYRPTGGGQFNVVRQLVFPAGFPLGFNKVALTGADIICVAQGDQFGIGWTDQGVIDWDPSLFTNYYMHIADTYAQGVNPTGTMTDTFGQRIYSIRVEFLPCDCGGGGASAASGRCIQCFCVEDDGTEITGTRTTDTEGLECTRE